MTALFTAQGEPHGLINELPNNVPFNDFRDMKPDVREKCIKEKKEDSRKVKARYINYQGLNERLVKPYCKYAGDPLQIWNFIPNHVYEVPLGLVNEVNDPNKTMPKREGLTQVGGVDVQKSGEPLGRDVRGERIHEFVSIAF